MFQLSTQVASKRNAALKESRENNFFEENICICDEDVEEEIPDGAIICDDQTCADRKMEEWDAQMQNETCICEGDDDDDEDDESSSEEGMNCYQKSCTLIVSSVKWQNVIVEKG